MKNPCKPHPSSSFFPFYVAVGGAVTVFVGGTIVTILAATNVITVPEPMEGFFVGVDASLALAGGIGGAVAYRVRHGAWPVTADTSQCLNV